MDFAWRVCAEWLLHLCGPTSSACVEGNGGIVIIFDPAQRLTGKRIRMLSRVADPSSTSPEHRTQVERAIEARDIVRMKQCVRTLLHYVYVHVRFVSQESGAPRSTQCTFRSRIYHSAAPPPTCVHGPKASFEEGLAIQLALHPTVHPWAAHVFFYLPLISNDPSLGDTLCAELSTGAPGATSLQTPRRIDDTASMMADATPTLSIKEEVLRCEVCLRTVPYSSCMFMESCPHFFCLTCVTLCAQKHCTLAVDATPSNMPCPSLCCRQCLLPSEVRMLVASACYAELEAAEVRRALNNNCVVCPSCTFTFESFMNAGIREDDPLRNKIQCGACGTEFCRRCLSTPFHVGRPCLEGGAGRLVPKCRYCGNAATTTDPCVCDANECQAKGRISCCVSKPCGHPCHGTNGEEACVACLEDGCTDRHETHCGDDFCGICYTDALREAPCLELACGHVFHTHCLEEKLEKRWPTARIHFGFASCPLCARDMIHPLLDKFLAPIDRLKEQLDSRYVERLKMEGRWECDALTNPSSEYFQNPLLYGRDKLNYYMCFKCERPYFGGLRECQNVDREEPDKADLICGGCSAGSAQCAVHGNQYMEWKCKYCCNTAVWYCWGTTHFCELCHSPPRKSVREDCPGEELCPLKGKHQPNGVEFAIGCAMCRAELLLGTQPR